MVAGLAAHAIGAVASSIRPAIARNAEGLRFMIESSSTRVGARLCPGRRGAPVRDAQVQGRCRGDRASFGGTRALATPGGTPGGGLPPAWLRGNSAVRIATPRAPVGGRGGQPPSGGHRHFL